MNTLIHADIFFFISSVGFVVLFVLLAIGLFYAIRAFRTWHRILTHLERNVDAIGETAKDMLEDVHESTIFRFLTGSRKRHKK